MEGRSISNQNRGPVSQSPFPSIGPLNDGFPKRASVRGTFRYDHGIQPFSVCSLETVVFAT